MTDREAAAGLVERLLNPQWVWSHEFRELDRAKTLSDLKAAAALITTLLSELERVGKENDKLRDLHRRASEETGELLGRALKAEALVAEAVRVCELFKAGADRYDQTEHPYDDEDWAITMVTHLRAARAFIEKAKS